MILTKLTNREEQGQIHGAAQSIFLLHFLDLFQIF